MTWLSGIGVVCLAVVMIKTTGVSTFQRNPGVGYSSQRSRQPSARREAPNIRNSFPTEGFYQKVDNEPEVYTEEHFLRNQPAQNTARTPSYAGQQGFASTRSLGNQYEPQPQDSQFRGQNNANGYGNPQNSHYRGQNTANGYGNPQKSQYRSQNVANNYGNSQDLQYESQPFPVAQTDSLLCRLGRALVETLENSDLTQNAIASYLAQSVSPQGRAVLVMLLEKTKKRLIEASTGPQSNNVGGMYGGGYSQGGNGMSTNGYDTNGMGSINVNGYGGNSDGTNGLEPNQEAIGNRMNRLMQSQLFNGQGMRGGQREGGSFAAPNQGGVHNIENEDEMRGSGLNEGVNDGGLGNDDTALRSGLGNIGGEDSLSEFEDDDTNFDDARDLENALNELKSESTPQVGSMFGKLQNNEDSYDSGLNTYGAGPDNGARKKRSALRYRG